MTEESSSWTHIRGLLEEIKEKVGASHPSGELIVTTADSLILSIYQRCVSLYRSVLILLDNNQAGAALILGRPLFTESLWLMELEEAGIERERAALILGHYVELLKRIEGLFVHDAKRLGLTDDPSDILALIQKQRRDIDKYRTRHGIGKLGKFSSENVAAERMNRKKDLWTFHLSHGMVHGGEAAYLYGRQKVEPEVVAFYSYAHDPDMFAEVGVFAARSITHALYAVVSIFDWDIPPGIDELIAELER